MTPKVKRLELFSRYFVIKFIKGEKLYEKFDTENFLKIEQIISFQNLRVKQTAQIREIIQIIYQTFSFP